MTENKQKTFRKKREDTKLSVKDITDNIAKNWIPKTDLGRKILNGEITDIEQIFDQNLKIREPEIVNYLIPNIKEEVMFIGGHGGKGGSKKRTPIRFSNKMHRAGRKRNIHAMVIVGNGNGLIGIGYESANDVPSTIQKAARKARLNLFKIRRGCGSWECKCHTAHSIPFKTQSKVGSAGVEFMPAPRGTGLAVSNEIKKIMKLAGIKDIYSKSRGNTTTRVNFIRAVINALKKLNKMIINDGVQKQVGLIEGVKK
jgi:small subunit ribosomal protein S5